MLQKQYRYMSISALALAALGLTANAQQACDLSDGLGLQPAAFQTETEACFEGLNGVTPDTFMQGQLGQFTAADRSNAGKASLENLATLWPTRTWKDAVISTGSACWTAPTSWGHSVPTWPL